MNYKRTIFISLAIYAIFPFGMNRFGFVETGNVALIFWSLALAGVMFQMYAIKTLPGLLKLIPIVPLLVFVFGIVGLYVYFLT